MWMKTEPREVGLDFLRGTVVSISVWKNFSFSDSSLLNDCPTQYRHQVAGSWITTESVTDSIRTDQVLQPTGGKLKVLVPAGEESLLLDCWFEQKVVQILLAWPNSNVWIYHGAVVVPVLL